jgi:cysteine desulfurase/selenocysteine lyase
VEIFRAEFAEFIGAPAGSIAMTPNTATGITTVARGLPWRAGESVVVPEIEFPSVVLPWRLLEPLGVKVRLVSCPDGRVTPARVFSACDWTTRAVALSWVQFSNGYRADLTAIGDECRRRRILLVVDGMQGVGVLPIDVSALPVDALAGQSYKWLLAPHGVGWLYVRPEVTDRIAPLTAGRRTLTKCADLVGHDFTTHSDARRFESGVPNLQGIVGALSSLRFLRNAGMDTVSTRVAALTARLFNGLLRRGHTMLTPDQGDDRSGIVVFRPCQEDVETCQARLAEAGVVSSMRHGGVRLSPHFYNTEDDVDRALAALD